MIEATHTSAHTPGPWRSTPGNIYGAIIAEPTAEYKEQHPEAVESYGGEVICESVMVQNRPIVIAAPEMFNALQCQVDFRIVTAAPTPEPDRLALYEHWRQVAEQVFECEYSDAHKFNLHTWEILIDVLRWRAILKARGLA